MVDAYEDFCGVERGRFGECTYADMEAGAAWPGFKEFRCGWHMRIEMKASDGTAVDLVEDLRSVLRWEERRLGAVSSGVLRQVIARLEAGAE
jgi:hypothetical protein